ncbi:hypothetical protein ACHAXA_001332 [Cyclostephanos tholiformis]|uniref:Uncharacterized protein n=1 Tax=Cyclostephanos tholiformis TaxID=382380 RepID=A0ABD3RU30_9STRA
MSKPPRKKATSVVVTKSRPNDVVVFPDNVDNRGKDDDDDASSPPTSPTSFSTFNLPSPRADDGGGSVGENDEDDEVIATDASTASSLLWGEDMTLTSVSEEEALAMKNYNCDHNHNRRHQDPMTHSRQQRRQIQPHQQRDDAVGVGERRFKIADDWDGLDHVILSATVFATATAAPAREGEGGDVVVMELLSTMDPQPSNRRRRRKRPSSRGPTTGTTTSSSAGNGRRDVVVVDEGSASSSLSTQASDQSSTHSKFVRENTMTRSFSKTKTTTPRVNNKTKSLMGDGGDEFSDDSDQGAENRTRILARRVLYWPSSILSSKRGSGYGAVNSSVGGGNRPSFVSLGRTTTRQDEDDNGDAASVSNENYEGWGENEIQNEDNDAGDDSHGRGVRKVEVLRSEGVGLSSSSDRGEDEERIADALEAFRSLNFLFGGGTGLKKAEAIMIGEDGSARSNQSSSYPLSGVDDSVSRKMAMRRRKKKLTQPLLVCLISNDGHVHFFYALRVLLAGKSSLIATKDGSPLNMNSILSNGFASMLFGSTMFAKMEKSVIPLSCPYASLKLSQVEGGNLRATTKISSSTTELGSSIDDYFSETGGRGDWSTLGQYDASIDPSSMHLCTIRQSNVLTGSCVTSDTSNSYLAICGRGLRRISQREASPGSGRRFSHVLGGFVTFVSLRHYAESRTIYLPFAPESIQPMYWSGMHFVMLLGEGGNVLTSIRNNDTSHHRRRPRKPFVMAVRVDCRQRGDNGVSYRGGIPTLANRPLYPDRFQCVPIKLPSVKESLGLYFSRLFSPEKGDNDFGIVDSKAIAASSIPSSPPGILISFELDLALVVVNHILLPFRFEPCEDRLNTGVSTRRLISLSTMVLPGHRALLASEKISKVVGCTGGQGWSLVETQGSDRKSYFICWDGATDSRGPYILPLQPNDGAHMKSVTSAVTPLMSYVKYAERLTEASHHESAAPSSALKHHILPSIFQQDDVDGREFLSGLHKKSFSEALKESIKMAAGVEGGIDEIIVNALHSISLPQHSPQRLVKTMDASRSYCMKSSVLSHQEKSYRLLRRCPTWSKLDDTLSNHRIVHEQVIVAFVRMGTHLHSLTLRMNVAANPLSTPFDQILSWLCQRRDYYTAASIALSLLDDADAVYELCRIPKSPEVELCHHKGLLDGIQSLSNEASHGNKSERLTYLADMTVSCLIKGAASSVLEGFLARNIFYSASHACIMLVGTTASAVSREPAPKLQQNRFENIVDMMSNAEIPGGDVIWPVRCLMKMAVVRKCLPSAIMLLNATIPDELRWRAPKSRGLSTYLRPSLGLFLALVEIIIESTDLATRYLLNMTDEDSELRYWFSISDDTRLALCLLQVHGKHVFLLEPEVRAWALDRLKEEIETPTDFTYTYKGPFLSNRWLREVVSGTFLNAECDIVIQIPKSLPRQVNCYRQDMVQVKEYLVPRNRSNGLDYDLVISALLILASRCCDCWREGEGEISTQTLLNTVCDMAGRKMDFEPKFIFDGGTVMRLCALADNIQSAAFLIGGRNGLILECADLLVSSLEISIQEAESALFAGDLVELKGTVPFLHERVELEIEPSDFTPNENHHHLLWLLQRLVIDVHSFGEFEPASLAGRITPVLAGTVCFRAWYCLTRPSDLSSSAKWLEKWMRKTLELTRGKSKKRLACAALVRALLWADEVEDLDSVDGDEEIILATMIGLNSRFMAELAQACCGLIQSIPPHLAEEILSSSSSSNMAFDSSLINATVRY